MAKLSQRATVQVEVAFTVDEAEARALDALVGYGDDAFIQAFYEKLGKAYMRDHEKGLRSFFKSVRELMPPILSRATSAREVFQAPNPQIAVKAIREAEWDARDAERAKQQAGLPQPKGASDV
jgi:hypothetical protein